MKGSYLKSFCTPQNRSSLKNLELQALNNKVTTEFAHVKKY